MSRSLARTGTLGIAHSEPFAVGLGPGRLAEIELISNHCLGQLLGAPCPVLASN